MTAEYILTKVRSHDAADDQSFKLHLFRDAAGSPCGWYIGPLLVSGHGLEIPYLPRSRRTRASIAVVRAIAAAKAARHRLCLVDPHNLWDSVWQPR